jgi:hypothetical protein
MEKMNLYEKIQAVSQEVMNIEKNMTVGSGNYSYKAVEDRQVTLAVKRSEAKHKIVSIPVMQEVVKSEVYEDEKTDTYNGKTTTKVSRSFAVDIKMTVKIIDLEKPDDFIEIVSFGKGIDTQDKAYGKASTYARKYALLNAYKIATGEDPDADVSPLADDVETKKQSKVETPEPLVIDAVNEMNKCKTLAQLRDCWSKYPQFQKNSEFIKSKETLKLKLN